MTATREAILGAARPSFAELGYEKATLRGIAEQVAVDPALVCHYIGTKDGLFAAALELPLQPAEIFEQAIGSGNEELGPIIVRAFLEAWEPPETRVRLMAMLRSAMTNDAAMGMIRHFLHHAGDGRRLRRFVPSREGCAERRGGRSRRAGHGRRWPRSCPCR